MRAWLRKRVTRRSVTAVALLAVAFASVVASQRSQGIARDEVVYMHAGSTYAQWWRGLLAGEEGARSRESITRHFGGDSPTANNREHPPLFKTLFGSGEHLFHQELGWTSRITGYRLAGALSMAVLVLLVFLFASSVYGYASGLIAALLTLLLPRVFFHAGLAAFDVPVAALWFACLFAYHKALASRWGFIVLGVCFGLALATKHNALMFPGVIGLHWLSLFVRRKSDEPTFRARLWDRVRSLRPQIWVAIFAIGPLLAIALWPWLWFDTAAHVGDWIGFHLRHVHYNFEYLGDNWNAPRFPWHVPLVTTLLTVPVVTLAAAVMGGVALVERWRTGYSVDRERSPGSLLLLSMLVATGPFFLGSTPIFGAAKHWIAALPSICIYAGVGVVTVSAAAARRLQAHPALRRHEQRLPALALAIVATLVIGAAFAETRAAQPYALSHYTALAGGPAGGAHLGMNRQFWGYSARGVLPFLNRRADATGPYKVYSHDASPAIGEYHRAGLLDRRVTDAGYEGGGIARSQAALVVHERHFVRHDFMIWQSYGTVQPAYVLTYRGVPLVSVYVRPEAKKP